MRKEELVAAIGTIPSARNQMVLWCAFFFGLTYKELAELRLSDLRPKLKALPKEHGIWATETLVPLIQKLLEQGWSKDDYIARSQKGRGAKPMTKMGLWRILKPLQETLKKAKATLKAGVLRCFRALASMLFPESQPQAEVQRGQEAPLFKRRKPLDLSGVF